MDCAKNLRRAPRRPLWRTAIVLLVCCAPWGAAKEPPIAVPPPTDAPATTAPAVAAASPTIPYDTLLEMYRAELGPLFRAGSTERIYTAHQLLERYFAGSPAERKAIPAQLDALGLDLNVIGRIARLRMHWPAIEGGAVFYVNERNGPYDVRYFFGVPRGYDRAQARPLVIKLPTPNAFLTDPRPDGNRVIAIYNTWIQEELAHHPDAVVLMPLLNLDELYGPSYEGMNCVIQSMLHIAGRVNVDPTRVYMIGHSESAHAAWNLALHYPTYFAAFSPLAGGAGADWQRLRLVNLRNVLPVVWHDADDVVVKVDSSRSIVKVLRGLRIDVDYQETKNIGHAPTPAIADERYDKMRARTRELYPHELSLQSNRPDTLFNRNDWLQLWQAITPGKDRRLYFRHGSGYMPVFQNPMRADAKITGNRIDVTTDNVESFRIGLNDQMVNLTQPVTVVVNKRAKFEAIVKQSAEEMLKDQLLLGRGWRYFSAFIDVDVVPPATRPTSGPATGPATTGPTSRPHRGKITVGPTTDDN